GASELVAEHANATALIQLGLVAFDPAPARRAAASYGQLADALPIESVALRSFAATATQLALIAARQAPQPQTDEIARLNSNLSVRLGALGRLEEALAAIEEAAGLYRELAAAHPDAFRPDLAASLNNLSIGLDALGRREEALAASEEAVTIRRELAAAHPDA